MKAKTKLQIRRFEHFLPYIAWLVALMATIGSLIMSELYHLPPCTLCWYQRILMYPLVIIIAVGVLRRERQWVYYVLPMAVIGMGIALYHSLLQWGIIPHPIVPCSSAVPCEDVQLDWLGFITIPFMSFIAFAVVAISTAAYWWVRPELGE